MCEGELGSGRTRIAISATNSETTSVDKVPERNKGAFSGWPTANDWYTGYGSGIMHCCTGNGARALYYIWENMLSFKDGVLSVNLLMNRPSKWADVNSYIPYTGQVDIAVKENLKQVRIRLPQWVKQEDFTCTIGGKNCTPKFDGRYAIIGAVKAGDKITAKFPISERKETVDIEKQQYYLTIKGNDVVDIFPRGQFCPLYQRNHYRDENVRWIERARFVSDESILW